MIDFQLENSEKGHGDMSISFGLVQPDDLLLTEWNASILGAPGVNIVLFEIVIIVVIF